MVSKGFPNVTNYTSGRQNTRFNDEYFFCRLLVTRPGNRCAVNYKTSVLGRNNLNRCGTFDGIEITPYSTSAAFIQYRTKVKQ